MTIINNYSLPLGDQISMDENLIKTFLRKNPRIGIGDNTSRYHYNVEPFENYGILLKIVSHSGAMTLTKKLYTHFDVK